MLTARLTLDQIFNAKHEEYIVRSKAHALRKTGTNASQWTRVTVVDINGRIVVEPEQMCAAFQRCFCQLFGNSILERWIAYSAYFSGML